MNNVSKSTSIFISTRNLTNSDSIANFTVDLEDDSLTLDNPTNQKFRLSLTDFAIPYLYNEISQLNNTIVINGMSISLLPGIYTYNNMASYINTAYGSTVVNFDQNQIKFVFVASTTITFPNINHAKIFGFNSVGPYTSNSSSVITSDRMIVEMLLKKIYVCIEDLPESSRGKNYDNLTSGQFKLSTILMPIPILVQPGQLIYHNNIAYAKAHAQEFQVDQIRNFTLTLRDCYGNLLQGVFDWEATVLVETIDIIDLTTRAMLNQLQNIGQDIKMSNVAKYLNYRNNTETAPYTPPKISVTTN